MSDIKTLIAGNWKMHGLGASLSEIELLARALAARRPENMEILVCPPATLLSRLREPANRAGITLGGQDCHAEQQGAHTGDISAEMLRDAGAATIIVGHSERRADHGETDATVRAKAGAVHRAGLGAIICLGETLAERDAGDTLAIVKHQLAGSLPAGAGPENTVIAYEPVWAIGTGRTPTVENVSEVHGCLRELLTTRFGADGRAFRILYGGSVKAANAHELLSVANVNGALVGGASLKAEDFYGIIDACPRSGA